MRSNLSAAAIALIALAGMLHSAEFTSGEWTFALSGNLSAADGGSIFSSLTFSRSDGNGGAWSISSSREGIMFFADSALSASGKLCETASASCPQTTEVYFRDGNQLKKAGTLSHSKKIEFKAQNSSSSSQAQPPKSTSSIPLLDLLPPYWPTLASVIVVLGVTVHYLLTRRS